MTLRVRLTGVTLADAPSINRWKNDAQIQALSSDTSSVESVTATENRILRWQASDPEDIVHFAVRLTADDTLLGFCHLAEIDSPNQRCKLGIVLGEPSTWGQGFGRETVSCLLEQAQSRGLTRVIAEVYADNARSARLFERAGFQLEGRLRASVFRVDHWVYELVYAWLAPERIAESSARATLGSE